MKERIVEFFRKISENTYFNQLIVVAIFFFGILEALVANGETYSWISPTQISIVLLFTFEAVFKLIGLGYQEYFRDGWNRFDFIIVVLSFLDFGPQDLGAITALRLLRLLRVVRLLKSFPAL